MQYLSQIAIGMVVVENVSALSDSSGERVSGGIDKDIWVEECLVSENLPLDGMEKGPAISELEELAVK